MIFLLAALALQSSSQAEYREHHCSNPQAQMDMNFCAALDFERADAELNRRWRDVIARARDADRQVDRADDSRPGSEQVLREAQRAWIGFRDAQCTYEGYEARGGSMEPMLYESCRARLTRERIRQLSPEPLGR